MEPLKMPYFPCVAAAHSDAKIDVGVSQGPGFTLQSLTRQSVWYINEALMRYLKSFKVINDIKDIAPGMHQHQTV